MRSYAVVFVGLSAVVLAGCSISASSVSSWSLSKSVRSSSRSSDSSSSSSPVARLAEEHGITNWEENLLTYTAIGEGLGSAKVSDAELMAYKRNLSRGDPKKADAIQKGYDSAR